MADCAIILYLECLIGLIYHFKKLGQCDLNKKIYIKICKNQNTAYFSIIMPRLTSNSMSISLRMLYLSCVKMRELH